MVEGFKSGFYTTSSQVKKEGRKQETKTQQSSLSQPQSILNQQPGIQQEERKQVLKTTHIDTPISAEKPRKQMKSTLHQEVTEFNPSGQMSMKQLIRVVLNLQKEVRKLKKDNDKFMEKLDLTEGIESKIMTQERELSVFLNISQDQTSQSQNQHQKQTELYNRLERLEEKLNEQRGDPMLIEEIEEDQTNQSCRKMLLLQLRATLVKKMQGIPELQELVLGKIAKTISTDKKGLTIAAEENKRKTMNDGNWNHLQKETFAERKMELEIIRSSEWERRNFQTF